MDAPVAWLVAAALLGLGLTRPIVSFSRLGGVSGKTFTVFTGMRNLFDSGHPYLAALIFTFSLVFPLVKLVALAAAWGLPMDRQGREVLLDRLKLLGKWSMLDVFVGAGLLGVVRFGWLTDATPHDGIYYYGASILLAMVLIYVVARMARLGRKAEPARALPLLTRFPLEVPALLLLAAGYELPLMHVEKWVFWKQDFSILAGTANLWRDGHPVLAVFLGLFVILAPTARLIGTLVLRFLPGPAPRHPGLLGLVRILNRWTMVEVFALGMLVVAVKLGGMEKLTLQPGLYCFLGGTALTALLAWPLGRAGRD